MTTRAFIVTLLTVTVTSMQCSDIDDEIMCKCQLIGNMCRSSSKLQLNEADICMTRSPEQCTECEWTADRCQDPVSLKSMEGCMSNAKGNCLSCMPMGKMCMSKIDPCKGKEVNCSSLHNCNLINGTCSMEVDPCLEASFCGDCLWTHEMCMPVAHSTGGTGQMIMTFFGGHDVVVLFDTIHVKTVPEYVGAAIVTALGGIVTVILKDFNGRCLTWGLPIRTVVTIIAITLSNLVMLIVMIMNTGLFIAAMAGSTIGWIIVEHLRSKRTDGDCEIVQHHDCHAP